MITNFLISLLVPLTVSCSSAPKPIPHWKTKVEKTDTLKLSSKLYSQEKKRAEISYPTDMVLLYGGGHHRTPYAWDTDRASSYVSYTDRNGKGHWLFDSFLLLEFMDPAVNGGPGKTLVTGYKYDGLFMPSANKDDWQRLINYYFTPGSGVAAIDDAVAKAEEKLGKANSKRKIVIGIPEPIVDLYSATHSGGNSYWGKIDGKELNFSNDNDRILACKWYIDEVRRQFYAGKYKHIELAGFYWVAETSSNTGSILSTLGKYLNKMKYSFNWIPYFNATGYSLWKKYGFNIAYLQPNYFFNESVPRSRLNEACDLASRSGMDMELEFDENALASNGRAYRLRDYMDAFKSKGVWASLRLAYYQGSWAVHLLKNSSDKRDQELYNDFCTFVVERPIRNEK